MQLWAIRMQVAACGALAVNLGTVLGIPVQINGKYRMYGCGRCRRKAIASSFQGKVVIILLFRRAINSMRRILPVVDGIG